MFNLTSFILSTFVLLFLSLFLGNWFGKIKFGKLDFGISGPLFVGIAIGYLVTLFSSNIPEGSASFERAQSIISGNIISGDLRSLFLMIFIVGSGLLASKDMMYALKKFGKEFAVLAIVIPLAGATMAYGMAYAVPSISAYEATGTFTGALTSSAGFGASVEAGRKNAIEAAEGYPEASEEGKEAILDVINEAGARQAELNDVAYEELTVENTDVLTAGDVDLYTKEAESGIGIGYSVGYPFGVLAVILAVNFIPSIFKINVEEEIKAYQKEKDEYDQSTVESGGVEKVADMDFTAFSLVAVLGYLLGHFKVPLGPLGSFSLGNVGGGMLVALFLGSLGQVGPFNFRMNPKVIGNLRQYFLSAFLGATGLNYGYAVVESLTSSGLIVVLIAIVVTFVSIIVGYLVGRYVFKMNWTILSGAITGGMTSAPGLGAAIDAVGVDDPATGYGATQPIATLIMVVIALIMYQLPMPL